MLTSPNSHREHQGAPLPQVPVGQRIPESRRTLRRALRAAIWAGYHPRASAPLPTFPGTSGVRPGPPGGIIVARSPVIRTVAFALVLAVVASIALLPAAALGQGGPTTVVLLHTSDYHSHARAHYSE